MSKKKNKTEWMSPAPVSEAPPEAADAPSNGTSAPPVVSAPTLPDTTPPVEPAGESASLDAFAPVPLPSSAEVPPPAAESPALEPAPPEAVPANIDLVLASPPEAAPLAILAADLNVAPLLERISRLEEALAHVQSLHGIEDRVAQRVATQLQREKPEAAPASSLRNSAVALLDAGKHLLPVLTMPGAAPVAVPVHPPSTSAQRAWLVWDMIAEARAILCMYVDPRYRLSWLGRTVPLGLFIAFFTTQLWVPFSSLPFLGWLPARVVEVGIGFLLFKVLGYESRRYRETAPDLPPSLRL